MLGKQLMNMKSLFPLSSPVPSPGAWAGPTPESPGWALLSWDPLEKQAGEWAWELTLGLRLKERGPLSTQERYNGQAQPG